jgi:transposase-like protein/predicted phosphodiesterase
MTVFNDDGYIVSCSSCGSGNLVKKGVRDEMQRWLCKDCNYRSQYPTIAEPDLIKENVRMAKQKQAFQDRNRIERKTFREHVRVENAVKEINEHILELLNSYKMHTQIKKHTSKKLKAVGVVHLSDLHFNELVDLPHNKYDFQVASKRIKRHIEASKKYFSTQDIGNVLLSLTGDLINSDRRLDEMLNNATNRASAVFIAIDIMQQAIHELTEDFDVSVACVSGNEARTQKEYGWSDILATDNYDFTIFNMLRALFVGSPVKFISGDPMELVITVAGQNLLMLHGHGAIGAKHESSVNQIMGRYANHGIPIDYVISGHIHSARVGDIYSRSSSMVGANDYSEKALNLSGRASQNCYIFYSNGNRDGIKVDLQNVKGTKGYDITKSLEAYNPKAVNKIRPRTTVFEIKI